MKAHAFPLAAACLLAITSQGAGQVADLARESLAGLDGLHVIIEELSGLALAAGLSTDGLQTYLEMRLREARIPVMSNREWLASQRKPWLYLNASAVLGSGGWAYSLGLEVKQYACIEGGLEGQEGLLALSGGCGAFTTWSRGGLYTAPGSLPDHLRGNLAKLMDMLVNDYLAVNP
jgi:hypothetical protein